MGGKLPINAEDMDLIPNPEDPPMAWGATKLCDATAEPHATIPEACVPRTRASQEKPLQGKCTSNGSPCSLQLDRACIAATKTSTAKNSNLKNSMYGIYSVPSSAHALSHWVVSAALCSGKAITPIFIDEKTEAQSS